VRTKTAHEVAKETETERAGGLSYMRSVENVRWAKDARMRYKKWRRSTDGQAMLAAIPRSATKGDKGGRKSAGATSQVTERTIEDRRGGGAMLDMDMLASLQAEFQDEGRGTLTRNTADLDRDDEDDDDEDMDGAGVSVGNADEEDYEESYSEFEA
jgi:hypothetical protein